MDEFLLGLRHITDPGGYDHMLFLLAMVCVFEIQDRKKIFWMITAFTIGHAITITMVGLDVFQFPRKYVEFAIPITILITCFGNIIYGTRRKSRLRSKLRGRYLVNVLFGLVHGMGFASFFKMVSDTGEGIVADLIFFNFGVEAGQLLFVVVLMLIVFLLKGFLRIDHRDWIIYASGGASFVSLLLAIENYPF